MTRSPDEYIVARRTLLDALDVLSEHTEAMVLVGAQAVYQRTGDVPGTGIPMTTDSDLAIDADLLADAPEMSGLLTDAGFSAASQPGHWISSHGIGLDLMGVPHQVPRARRSAGFRGHDRSVARVTPGLEPSLVDCSHMTVGSLEDADPRVVRIKVAGSAALLTAKLTKLRERHDEHVRKPDRPSRLKEKDVLDCYRLLVAIPTEELVEGFARHNRSAEAREVSRRAVDFLVRQSRPGEHTLLMDLLSDALLGDLTAPAAFGALVEDLAAALTSSGWPGPGLSGR